MKQEFQRALAKGLPYPILTIAEYLSQDGEGFHWGRSYRLAGYYTGITLWYVLCCAGYCYRINRNFCFAFLPIVFV